MQTSPHEANMQVAVFLFPTSMKLKLIMAEINTQTWRAICPTIIIFETLRTLKSLPWLELDTKSFNQAENYYDQVTNEKAKSNFPPAKLRTRNGHTGNWRAELLNL